MNKIRALFIGFLLSLILLNGSLIYQCYKYKSNIIEERSLRYKLELTLSDAIQTLGSTLPLDSISRKHHLIIRFNDTTCLSCVIDAEALLENVFGREFVLKELCIVGSEENSSPLLEEISETNYADDLTPLDHLYTPYLCIVNDQGDVLFSIILPPDNYQYNRGLLSQIKDNLSL